MAITRNKQRTTGATTIGMPGSRALGGSRHPFQPSAHYFSSNYRNRLSTLSISVLTQAGCRLSLGGVSASRLVLATPMPSIDSIRPDESWAASPFIPFERVGQG